MTMIIMNRVSEEDEVEECEPRLRLLIVLGLSGILFLVILPCLFTILVTPDASAFGTEVVRGENGIVFGRLRIVEVHKMASPKEAEVVAPPHALSDEFIDDVNSRAFAWEAGRNFAEDTPMAYIKKLMGVKRDRSMEVVEKLLNANRPISVGGQPLPTDFDARTKWPQCKSISEIRDQGGCGSCWALGAVETMTDRQCIHKNEIFHYSAVDLVSCCADCGDGCDGGDPMSAFIYWTDQGIVSGGACGSYQGCRPYEIEPCEHHISGNRGSCSDGIKTPVCRKQCDVPYYSTYGNDLRYAKTIYALSTEEEIIRELVANGPMEATFDVYEDFLHYKSGVYHTWLESFLVGTPLGFLASAWRQACLTISVPTHGTTTGETVASSRSGGIRCMDI